MLDYYIMDPDTKLPKCVTQEEYSKWDKSNVQVKRSILRHYIVSSVFLTVEYWGYWFETYIFKAKGTKDNKEISNWMEVHGRRHRTYEEALAYHQTVLDYYKEHKTVPKYGGDDF